MKMLQQCDDSKATTGTRLQMRIHGFAQTNLQLLHQLQEAGYSDAEQITVNRAYGLATQLFTGCFRGSGKPFICHLVGTASILATVQAPVEVVAAGLLHAAYELGDFGDGSRGISAAKRKRVQRVVGSVVETYVAEYTALQWNQQTIPLLRDRLSQLTQTEHHVLLMRLANELEDHLDAGVLYCRNVEKRLRYVEQWGNEMAEMAAHLGYPLIAIELTEVFQSILATTISAELRSSYDYSYWISTSSLPLRWWGRVRDRLTRRLGGLRKPAGADA